ncbi:hypothetical protein BD324DRAFT_648797 [Kockovaella imperatae]|uniref:WSC domain-containing protein n=1 Tax=Kockovaella imperatae TaxID=4999 RepID=A0A1Y1URG3_9TREE|nr:hypothetical protein BD324DRAFT_648797 [Kockovaella imperatae]ORX40197.1 hypothetical protein BD324DRAFT_648797 [Kockovaella imperatae]
MKASTLFVAAISAVGMVSASPVAENESTHQLEARETRSSQGWYSYGCYMDCYNGMNRFLPHVAYWNNPANDPDTCIAACQDAGYTYAGLQWGVQCFCGNSLNGSPPTASTDCFERCTGSADHAGAHCGGACRNNIWSAFEKPGH